MMYKIFDTQVNRYVGSWSGDEGRVVDGVRFESLEACRDYLISYHRSDDDEESLNERTLEEICSGFEWEIHDEEGNTVAL